MTAIRTALCLLALALIGAPPANAQIVFQNPDFESQIVVESLDFPTAVAWAPDGRMFIVEKKGVLKVLNPGEQDAVEVLDLSSIVGDEADRGMLGVAVDAQYAANNYVYLLYSRDTGLMSDDPGPMVAQLARYTITPANTVTDVTVILGSHVPASGGCPAPDNAVDCIPSDSETHSIGSVRAAADGTLWVGSGDGADYGGVDPRAFRSYDEQTYAGKIMHVDRNGLGLLGHPFCLPDSDLTHVCTKLFAKGFRNPFRFQLRPGGLAVGDVGWNTREEVDLLRFDAPAKSYGWPCYEGTIQTPAYADTDECAAEYAKPPGTHLGPAYDYGQNPDGAVHSGPVYTATAYPPQYRDKLFFGDYTDGSLSQLAFDAQDQVTAVEPFATGLGTVDVELAPNGNLAHVAIFAGRVEEIVYTPGARTPNALAAGNPTSGSAPLAVQFTGSGSTDPDDEPLTYDWDFGDGTPHSNLADPSHTYAGPGNYTATLTVTDPTLRTDSDSVTVSAGNDPPSTPTISTPADESLYRDGQAVTVAGSATDPQEGSLPPSALTWTVTLHHASHSHPILNDQGTASTSFEPSTDHDADSYYDITLTARDAQGLTSARTIQVRPETVGFAIQSSPEGAPVSYAGADQTAPFSTQAAIGFETSVSAAQQFTQAGHTWEFDNWSDGGARLHNLTIPASATTLTATYRDITPGSVTIVKQTEPVGAADSFDFSGDLGTFALTGGTGTNSHSVPVPAGTYAVTEAAEAGWDLAQLSCTDGSATSGHTATIVVSPGEDVTCIFRNAKQGRVTITKQTDPAGATDSFDFSGNLGAFALTGATGANSRTSQLAPGSYAVTEAATTGWELTQLSCSDGSATSGRTATIDVSAGEDVTCVFRNTKQGGVTIEKQTLPDGAPGQFEFTGSGPLGSFGLVDGQIRFVPLPPGTYSVSEQPAAGWDLTGLHCSPNGTASGATATVVVGAGQSAHCVFTSTRRGNITIRTLTDPPEQPPLTLFSFNGDPPLESFELGHGQTRVEQARPGTYVVREGPRAGYAVTTVSCDDADSTGSVGSREATIELGPGEAVTCTFTTRRKPADDPDQNTAGPTISFLRLAGRRSLLIGSARDPDGVRAVDVAVGRAVASPKGCRWWSRKAGRLQAEPRPCTRPRWLRARLVSERWRLRLGGRLPSGRFRLIVRAVDELGDRSRLRDRLESPSSSRSSEARARSPRTPGRTRQSSG